ncbi:NAD(P)-binding protein [Suhomyces tanzawaensis NRRL Y-17324]|uniref:NAD(P)-binding protein n=1 Tax=Suhomyces tanzawaensis NRRL Y-17324 TaxID=984487 RepID=A0A1E4SPG0_9ASCO|nr:NAD(P)-binding protein [Suhomyces tanzawaensis NRRL Y-17324]ODV81307.1 NAD(P)-binding protein [Suhomyces tanzawaensis NRRL Y-17324]
MSSVFISGASGYLAQHIFKLLIANGYKVVGSVRSEAKGEYLKTLFTENFEYAVVPDIAVEGAFDEALKSHPEVVAFFHTASPFNFDDDGIEEKLLKPAVGGTRNCFVSAKAYGKNLKRFILTSSYAANAWSYLVDKTIPEDVRTTEETWTEISYEQAQINGYTGYHASKALAEKEAWKFIKEEKPDFELVAINPVYIFGPQAFDSEVKDTMNVSAEVINQFLKLKSTDPLPIVKGLQVDVRDVAKAHLFGLERDDYIGQRVIVQHCAFSQQTIANILNEKYPELNLPKGDPESEPESIKRVVHGDLDDSNSKKLLGLKEIDLVQTVVDSVDQILRAKKAASAETQTLSVHIITINKASFIVIRFRSWF